MIIKLKTFEGQTIKTIENVIDVSQSCIEGHVFIQALKENFIFAIQKNEFLMIDKTDNN